MEVPAAIGSDRTEEGVKAAGTVAVEAVQTAPERTLVLGSVPPLNASYAVDKVGPRFPHPAWPRGHRVDVWL